MLPAWAQLFWLKISNIIKNNNQVNVCFDIVSTEKIDK